MKGVLSCVLQKRIIFASGGLELLQMVSESDTGQYSSEDVESIKGVDCEVSYRLERGTKHSLECGNLSRVDVF